MTVFGVGAVIPPLTLQSEALIPQYSWPEIFDIGGWGNDPYTGKNIYFLFLPSFFCNNSHISLGYGARRIT